MEKLAEILANLLWQWNAVPFGRLADKTVYRCRNGRYYYKVNCAYHAEAILEDTVWHVSGRSEQVAEDEPVWIVEE